jgi:hypothetical protein
MRLKSALFKKVGDFDEFEPATCIREICIHSRLMNRMTKFARAFVFVLSIAAVAVAAGSWTISDATLAVGPKGKEPTSSFKYFKILHFKLTK